MAAKPNAEHEVEVETKLCARCLTKKPLDEFENNTLMKSGKKSYCKPCHVELRRIWARSQ